MLSNCGAGEDSWQSLRLQGNQTSQSSRKSTLNIHWKDWSWCWNFNTTWCKELTHWKNPWCWERLKATGEEDSRGWDGWMASLNQWRVWAHSMRWWRTGKPGVLQSIGLQRVGHDLVTEQQLEQLKHLQSHWKIKLWTEHSKQNKLVLKYSATILLNRNWDF